MEQLTYTEDNSYRLRNYYVAGGHKNYPGAGTYDLIQAHSEEEALEKAHLKRPDCFYTFVEER